MDSDSRAAELASRLELESVGVDCFSWSSSRSWSRQNFADSVSGPESQANTRQQTIILAERLKVLPKTLKDWRWQCVGKVEIT